MGINLHQNNFVSGQACSLYCNFVNMKTRIESVVDLGAYAFWDTDVHTLELQKDKKIIVPRLFERAKLEDILNAIIYYGIPACASILKDNPHLSLQAVYLGHLLLSVPLEKFKAYVAPRNHF